MPNQQYARYATRDTDDSVRSMFDVTVANCARNTPVRVRVRVNGVLAIMRPTTAIFASILLNSSAMTWPTTSWRRLAASKRTPPACSCFRAV